MLHPVDQLFLRLKTFNSYPTGVSPIPVRIPGTAFFPGGDGLWLPEGATERPPMPVGKVMVLGHSFDSEAGYRRSLIKAGENLKGPTWRNLLKVLDEAGIPPGHCFFTNFFMGLFAGDKPIGKFPGARDTRFVEWCRAFLVEQIAVQKPKLILALGGFVPDLVGPLAPKLAAWAKHKTLKELDEAKVAVLKNVRLGDNDVTLMALTHPCLRGANVIKRHYHDFTGSAAEHQMLQDALTVFDNHVGRNLQLSG